MIREEYDLIVIGSGPAGEWASIQGCKLGKRVALIEKKAVIGGVCVHTGTLPSKTLRESSLYYSGLKKRSFYGFDLSLKHNVTVQQLMHRKNIVVENEMMVIIDQLLRNGIKIFGGAAEFVDNHTVAVFEKGVQTAELKAEHVIICVGTRPNRIAGLEYDNIRVFDGETIIELDRIPKKMAILGGGVIGCEWASIFSKLDIEVTLIDKREQLLGFLDREFATMLFSLLEENGIRMALGQPSSEITVGSDSVTVTLKDGSEIKSDILLVTAGRRGNTDSLKLDRIGLETDKNGLLAVDECYHTAIPNIYAVGDVIGFPSLAATSMDQGRRAALAAFTGSCQITEKTFLPFGIYTIPEISYVGETEESLKEKGQKYETGVSHFFELPRGQINNDHDGMLKLLFDPDTRKILGVHIIGERATEIVHIGQAVMSYDGKIDYFADTVMNYPTIAEAYKTAALNGLNKLGIVGYQPRRSMKQDKTSS